MKTILALACVLLCGAGLLFAAGNVTTTINKTCSQYGLPFASSPYTITGSQYPPGEFSVSYGTAQLLNDGVGSVMVANCQMLYVLCDSLDCTAAFYANSAGTGSTLTVSGGTSLSLQAGIPYEWDTSAGTCPVTANWSSLKITAGTTAQGVPSSGTATNVHIRSSLSQ